MEETMNNFIITKQDEISAMQFLVQILYEHQIISEKERNKILAEYY